VKNISLLVGKFTRRKEKERDLRRIISRKISDIGFEQFQSK
jgi:hypothetical protein